MEQTGMQKRAHKVRRFLTVQLIALIGWIIVQSFFSLTPPGRAIPPIRNYHRDRSDLVDCNTRHYVFLVQTRI